MRASGSDRSANGHFALTAQSTGEQEIGDIDAGDDEQTAHRAKQYPERISHIPHQGAIQANDRCATADENGGMRFAKALDEAIDFGAALRFGDSRAEAADHAHLMIVVRGKNRIGKVTLQRDPHFGLARGVAEVFGHHAHDVVFDVVQPNLAMKDVT